MEVPIGDSFEIDSLKIHGMTMHRTLMNVSTHSVHADDICSEICENHPAERAWSEAGEFENADSSESHGHESARFSEEEKKHFQRTPKNALIHGTSTPASRRARASNAHILFYSFGFVAAGGRALS